MEDDTSKNSSETDKPSRKGESLNSGDVLHDRVVLFLGATGALLWFALFALNALGLAFLSVEELALLGLVVSALLQVEFLPEIFRGVRGR